MSRLTRLFDSARGYFYNHCCRTKPLTKVENNPNLKFGGFSFASFRKTQFEGHNHGKAKYTDTCNELNTNLILPGRGGLYFYQR